MTPIEKFHALPPDAQARAIARLPESDQRKLFDGLRKLQEHAERTKFYRMFPDKGPHRRELYPKHCDVIAKSQQDRFIAFLGGNGTGKTELGAYIATAHAIGDYLIGGTGGELIVLPTYGSQATRKKPSATSFRAS